MPSEREWQAVEAKLVERVKASTARSKRFARRAPAICSAFARDAETWNAALAAVRLVRSLEEGKVDIVERTYAQHAEIEWMAGVMKRPMAYGSTPLEAVQRALGAQEGR